MPEIEVDISEKISVDIEIYCGKCGAGLCMETEPHNYRQAFVVNPCPNCLEESYQKGFDKGQEDTEEMIRIRETQDQAIEDDYKKGYEEDKDAK